MSRKQLTENLLDIFKIVALGWVIFMVLSAMADPNSSLHGLACALSDWKQRCP